MPTNITAIFSQKIVHLIDMFFKIVLHSILLTTRWTFVVLFLGMDLVVMNPHVIFVAKSFKAHWTLLVLPLEAFRGTPVMKNFMILQLRQSFKALIAESAREVDCGLSKFRPTRVSGHLVCL